MQRDFVVDFANVKRYWLDCAEGRATIKQRNLKVKASDWQAALTRRDRTTGRRSWEGATPLEMKEWMRNGYKGKGIEKVKLATPTQEAPKTVWNEEGEELDLFKAYSGDPTPFMSREPVKSKPGIRIVVDYAMSCGTDSTTIEAFGTWISALADAFNRAGFDSDIDTRIAVRELYSGDGHGDLTNVNIRIKKMGTKTDFASWSPVFSPAGFRMLGFTAMWLSGDHFGKQCASSLGQPAGAREWGVRWDATTRTLFLDSPSTPHNFPVEKMTDAVKATGLLG
jgi:hypothetical protein